MKPDTVAFIAIGLLGALGVIVVVGLGKLTVDAAEGFMQLVHALNPEGK